MWGLVNSFLRPLFADGGLAINTLQDDSSGVILIRTVMQLDGTSTTHVLKGANIEPSVVAQHKAAMHAAYEPLFSLLRKIDRLLTIATTSLAFVIPFLSAGDLELRYRILWGAAGSGLVMVAKRLFRRQVNWFTSKLGMWLVERGIRYVTERLSA